LSREYAVMKQLLIATSEDRNNERQHRMVQPGPTSICQEYLRLLAQYKDAVGKLTVSGVALSESAISYEADMFNKAWEISQDAWHECSRRRHEMQQHVIRHGC